MDNQGRSNNDRLPVRQYDLTASELPKLLPDAMAAEWAPAEHASLIEYWHILRRRKWTLLLIVALALAATAGITLLQTPAYRARASLEIQGLNENFLNIKDLDPTDSARFTAEANLLTQIQLLQSESLLERVIARLNLAQRHPAPRGLHRWFPAERPIVSPTPRDSTVLVNEARRHLTVRPIGQTRIVEMIYDADDPQVAADFVNTLGSEFMNQVQEARWAMSQQTAAWLTRNLQDMKAKLQQSEDQLQAFARASGLLFTSGSRPSAEPENIEEQKLRRLQEELLRAQAERMTKQSKYEEISALAAESLSQILDDGNLRTFQANLTDLRRQMAEMRTSLTPLHPKVVKAQAQITELERALMEERQKILRDARSNYESAERHEQLLNSAYTGQMRLVSELTAKTVHYDLLKREVDTSRQMYDTMLQKVKEAGIAGAMRATTASLVDSAKPPRLPRIPNIPLNSTLGLLAGFLIATGWILVRERTDKSLHVPGEARAFLKLPELGVIPSAELSWVNGQNGRSDPDAKLELVTWQHKKSVLADSYRSTMDSILFSSKPGSTPRIVLITSVASMEGKTTATTNLGIALAEIGRRVVLIDADTRRPQLHRIFSLSNQHGLTTMLDPDGKVDLLPADILVQKTEVPRLFVVPSGPEAHSISEMLHSTRMRQLLARLRREFDIVLIDSPPLVMPDARELGRLSEGVILVLRAGSTQRELARAICERFAQDGTPILGTILSHFNPKAAAGSPYESQYYYDSHYYKNYTVRR